MGVMGKLIEESALIDVLEEESNDPAKVQEKLICRILRDNLHTQYLQRFGLSAASKHDFKELVPIISYEDLKPDIQRIAAGDKSPILSAESVAEFLISSGTSSGEQKLYPKPADYTERMNVYRNIGTALLYKNLPALKRDKMMQFIYFKKPGLTPCGLISRTVLTSLCQMIVSSKDYSNFMLSPREVILYPDFFQSTYCQLLCGLIQRPDVVHVATLFGSTLVRIIRLLEVCWADICEDLETGQLNSAKITDISVREAMARVLQPNPELASSIRAECSKKSWQGIIRRLWPNTEIIETIVTGSMQQYIPTIDYYSDGIQIVSLRYSSSETFLGINTNPLCSPWEITYMLAPGAAFFEFLSVDRSSELVKEQLNSEKRIAPHGKDVVDLTDVKLGKEYELLVTTPTGLYRYRVGDILKVEGYYNATPTFSFVCRRNVLLSIDCEKTDEKDLHHAVTTAAASCKQTVIIRDYSSYVELQSKPPHYVIFWEVAEMRCEGVEMEAEEEEVKEWCAAMEESLNSTYRSLRRQGAIGALEIRVVKKGSFERVTECCVERGGNAGQVKVPRCLKTPSPLLEALEEGVYLKAFSSRMPFYSPNVRLVP